MIGTTPLNIYKSIGTDPLVHITNPPILWWKYQPIWNPQFMDMVMWFGGQGRAYALKPLKSYSSKG